MLLDELHAQRETIAILGNRFGARHIRVFGSVARGEEKPGSDVDLLVEFERHFELAFPLDLRRPPALLTSESFLHSSPWRLPPPWRPPNGSTNGPANDEFRAITVLGLTGIGRSDG